MSTNRQISMPVCAFLMLLGLSFSAARAQTVARIQAGERAERLHQRAVELHGSSVDLAQAGRLHIMEAKLRQPGDPRASECLKLAAYLLAYAGRVGDARYAIERAAREALNRGDVNQAAMAYVEAAFIAERQRRPHEVRSYAERARVLAQSAALSEVQREAILSRLSFQLAAASAER